MNSMIVRLCKTFRDLATLSSFVLLVLVATSQNAMGQDQAVMPQEQVDQMMEMMKKSGLTPEQLQGMQSVLQDVSQQEAQHRAGEAQAATAEFDAATAGHGKAFVTVAGERHEYQVSECDTERLAEGIYFIEARKGPGKKVAGVEVYGRGHRYDPSIHFRLKGSGDNYEIGNSPVEFDGQKLEWEGIANAPAGGQVPAAISLTCGQ